MPFKRKRPSKEAERQRKAVARSRETEEEKRQRRHADCVSHEKSRAEENPNQTSSRQSQQRARTSAARANENPQQTSCRQSQQRARTSAARANENPEQTSKRQRLDCARTSAARANENPEQTSCRLSDQRARTSAARARAVQDLTFAAFHYDPSIKYNEFAVANIGAMNQICSHCGALKWKGEPPGLCCDKGKVKLEPLSPPPEPLKSLLDGSSPSSKHFLANITKYNKCFQMTSFGASKVIRYNFMPTFKVQGQCYHLIGSLLPPQDEQQKFLQIYFIANEEEQARIRGEHNAGVRGDIVLDLQRMMHSTNAYVNQFKTALENLPSEDYRVIICADRTPHQEHQRRFNAPVSGDVGIVIVGQEFHSRDIVIQTRSTELQRISEIHPSYDPLQYPIIFAKGENGYSVEIPQIDPLSGQDIANKSVSSMDYYSFRLMIRQHDFNTILRCSTLFHQYVVDMYAKVETERLNYIRRNQQKLRATEYVHLRDAINNDANTRDIGQMVILPSSYTGGPRYMHERTQDAMVYVRHYGAPSLFITFTCNPKWPEITNELLPGQTNIDRHDLLARVFERKLISFIDYVTKCHIFGITRCHMVTIEWQKRGKPHAHMLFWLTNPIRPEQYDNIVSAELPDPEEDPDLHEIIKSQMIHGPCGAINPECPCMKNGKCTKNFPKSYQSETISDFAGYPLYRRRKTEEGGSVCTKKVKGQNVVVDNRWVVPHSKMLCKTFDAHINVEICCSVKAIQYITKYINKGSDQAVFAVTEEGAPRDEILQYQLGRYISSNEAIWRILGFPIHRHSPAVMKLSVHLEDGQRVYFRSNNATSVVAQAPKTTLTAFFTLCASDDFAKTLLYPEVPRYYTWTNKKFQRRKRGEPVEGWPGVKKDNTLGRVYTVHPTNFECFCLRLLLHKVRGPTSFEYLKTFNGEIMPTFRDAASRHGLLEDDEHWHKTLEEASSVKSSSRLRDLFVILLKDCFVSNPVELWSKFKEAMTSDILHKAQMQNRHCRLVYTDSMYQQSLIIIQEKLSRHGCPNLQTYGFPAMQSPHPGRLSAEMLQHTAYNVEDLHNNVARDEPRLTPDQRNVYDILLHRINSGEGGVFFLDAPGGTGKTFLLNLLLSEVRRHRDVAIAVAFSGIAATLLDGGRTAHSQFKLPLNLVTSESPCCNIQKGTGKAMVLQECKLIVWDECTMMHKNGFEALDRTLQDLRNSNNLFGGATLLLAGDFRQTLPIVTNGTPADQLQACLKASYIWQSVEVLQLSTNMRAHIYGDESASEFSRNILTIGDGLVPHDANGLISLPPSIGTIVKSCQELKDKVFPGLRDHYCNEGWLYERAILAPKNQDVMKINNDLLDCLPGAAITYLAVDKVTQDNDAVHYPTEFLNSLDLPGLPQFQLSLKIGAPIMLLRNLDAPRLCNGTRLIVKRMMPHVLEATILTGCGKGEDVFIPKIALTPSDLPFSFKRLQFPIRLAFAMTINKSQGQSLRVAGLYLETPCFGHGQLYVACSRVGTKKNLFVFSPNGKTANIVYPRALQRD